MLWEKRESKISFFLLEVLLKSTKPQKGSFGESVPTIFIVRAFFTLFIRKSGTHWVVFIDFIAGFGHMYCRCWSCGSLRKQLTFSDTNAGFPSKWRRATTVEIPSTSPRQSPQQDQSEALPRSGKSTSSVWNFYSCWSDVTSRDSQWWRREISVVFSC